MMVMGGDLSRFHPSLITFKPTSESDAVVIGLVVVKCVLIPSFKVL